jgi:hypothetical protein
MPASTIAAGEALKQGYPGCNLPALFRLRMKGAVDSRYP